MGLSGFLFKGLPGSQKGVLSKLSQALQGFKGNPENVAGGEQPAVCTKDSMDRVPAPTPPPEVSGAMRYTFTGCQGVG